ncbi:glycoside hydrolase family 2 TIM barrel-domain containing protein [Paraflavitalea sp. CAU 1676]|uniref:glycoside hydrolase family 2 protein n=1 Tax=Paraflavitalea sp. CAU 1676 TaxID=3032598 RepID=UPI0023DCA1CB|nr:glycoside hydrolase family 2 TIM barrel-domain containing protein [Paraflavitalea sp. CAU 1676]MDF2190444.1 glycoside hydrolase family 2 TIM barrel-domain containing protein [Paraflavitalea sp. CAU 1676]
MLRTLIILLSCMTVARGFAQQTELLYLSGTGNDHTVDWDFFCTDGSKSGKWTTIPVPSCWELQGFGKYNYGFDKDSVRGKEKGLYKYKFRVPASWAGKVIRIVFEGSMTDTEVKINGQVAGPVHEGAFYAFKYDITSLLKVGGENLLEVTVAKHSANGSVNEAERKADFWIFGGIFRPVYLEALPGVYINEVAIDARANGQLTARVVTVSALKGDVLTTQLTTIDGKPFGAAQTLVLGDGVVPVVVTNKYAGVKAWSPEFPRLYELVFTLVRKGKAVHRIKQRIGFRTVEVKQRDGIYVNGVKVKMKGVNRHSFWPSSGRTTSKDISIKDVLLMKEMNMNAVRMSHYPPDGHFLDVCDSLGLFVMDELAGWHGHYDTPTGTKRVAEMLAHDVNHPSIIFWANGNEGGHNFELDHLFTEGDIQQRPVVHPWQLFGGFDTQHYREFNYGIGNYNNGREIVMPTEFLHGWYDGGHGAGLQDYWEAMWHEPLSAGGFLWDFADQGVVRSDKNGLLDTDKNRGADGIVGPYHEKEGSFYTIKEVWSPVVLERREITPQFDGSIRLENRYFYTNINQCTFSWQLTKWVADKSLDAKGTAKAPTVAPGEKGELRLVLPANWSTYDALYVTATDPYGKELFTWSFPIVRPATVAAALVDTTGSGSVELDIVDSLYRIKAGGVEVGIHQRTGLLSYVRNGKGEIPFNNGPVLQEGVNNFQGFTHRYDRGRLVIASSFERKNGYNTMEWTIYPSGWIRLKVVYFPDAYFTSFVGVNFSFPENRIKAVEYMGAGPYRVWKNRLKGTRFGVWHKDYNGTETGESWVYPEFKGYHANMYWCKFIADAQSFTVVTDNEDTFLRLFTPAWKEDQWKNYMLYFPSGDISFMQGIAGIGTKTQRNETTGPMGLKNIFYDYEKDQRRAKELVLYFNFNVTQP